MKGVIKMNLNHYYQYQMVLSLANREVSIAKISEEIEVSVREFNIRSKTAKNIKLIEKFTINKEENLLYIWLNSNSKLASEIRGISLLTKLLMQQLNSDDEKNKLLKDIIRNKCFFKVVEEPKEVKKLKFEKSNETEKIEEFNILTNDNIKSEEKNEVQGNNINLSKINALMSELILLREHERILIDAINKELKEGAINESK